MHDFLFLPRRRKEVERERQSRSTLCRLLPRCANRSQRGSVPLSFSIVRYIKLSAPVPPLFAYFRSRRVRRGYDSRRIIVITIKPADYKSNE